MMNDIIAIAPEKARGRFGTGAYVIAAERYSDTMPPTSYSDSSKGSDMHSRLSSNPSNASDDMSTFALLLISEDRSTSPGSSESPA